MRQVVLGAGPLGTSLAERLRACGHEVALWSVIGNPAYDMPGTEPEALDGADAAALRQAVEGADVVYLCLNAHYVDWYELYPPRLRATVEAAAAVGAALVYHDNVYMYGPVRGPLTEDLPYDATTRKGRLRGRMAREFLQAAESGRIRGVIGRSADMYGPGALNSSFNSTLGQRHFYPLLAGKTVSVLGNVKAPHTYGYVPDVARGLAVLGEAATRGEGLARAWHLPAARTLSHRELLGLAGDLADVPGKVRGSRVSGYVVRGIGLFQSDVGEVSEMLYQFERPLEVSHEQFHDTFDLEPTPHAEALRVTLDWYREHPEYEE